jgi:hypothetical protein
VDVSRVPFTLTGADAWTLAEGTKHGSGIWAIASLVHTVPEFREPVALPDVRLEDFHANVVAGRNPTSSALSAAEPLTKL